MWGEPERPTAEASTPVWGGSGTGWVRAVKAPSASTLTGCPWEGDGWLWAGAWEPQGRREEESREQIGSKEPGPSRSGKVEDLGTGGQAAGVRGHLPRAVISEHWEGGCGATLPPGVPHRYFCRKVSCVQGCLITHPSRPSVGLAGSAVVQTHVQSSRLQALDKGTAHQHTLCKVCRTRTFHG